MDARRTRATIVLNENAFLQLTPRVDRISSVHERHFEH